MKFSMNIWSCIRFCIRENQTARSIKNALQQDYAFLHSYNFNFQCTMSIFFSDTATKWDFLSFFSKFCMYFSGSRKNWNEETSRDDTRYRGIHRQLSDWRRIKRFVDPWLRRNWSLAWYSRRFNYLSENVKSLFIISLIIILLKEKLYKSKIIYSNIRMKSTRHTQ